MTGTHEEWSDEAVWQKLEYGIALFRVSELAGGGIDDPAFLPAKAEEARARIHEDANDHRPYRTLAMVRYLQGNRAEAIEAMRTSLRLDPKAVPPVEERG